MSPTSSQPSGPDYPGPSHPQPRARSRRRAGIAALIAAPVVLAATIGWSVSHDDTSHRPEAASDLTALRAALPLSGLLISAPATAREVHRAEQALIATCMARQGFRYDQAPDPAPAGSEAAGDAKSYFGIESVGPAGAPGRQPVEHNQGKAEKAFQRALYGDSARRISARNKVISVSRPATGCLAEAETRLLGKSGRQRDLTLRLALDQGERDSADAVVKDPALRAANTDWRTCMAEAGIKSPNPRDFAQRLPGDTDPATDRRVIADLACKKQTHYLERAYSRFAAIQRTWLTRHQEQAAEWKSLRGREARQARQVLQATTDDSATGRGTTRP